jgi:hypothetical protein
MREEKERKKKGRKKRKGEGSRDERREGKRRHGKGREEKTRGSEQADKRRMSSSGMLRRVALVRTAVSEKVPSSPSLVILMLEALSSFETSGLTRAARRNIPEDGNLRSHRREHLNSYIAVTGWAL